MLPLLAITFNSCSKDDDGNGNGNEETVALVKKISNPHFDWYVEFQYDDQQRLIKAVEYDNGYMGNLTFSYGNNKITATLDKGAFEEYTLNDDGYLIQLTDEDGVHSVSYTYMGGYLSGWITSYGDSTASYTWSNGNMTEVKYDDGDEYSNVYTYTNHVNKTNLPFPDFFLDLDMPLKFKGTFSKNLPLSLTKKDEGDVVDIINYSYTFNSDGNPTEIKSTYNDGYSTTAYFTYY